MLHFYINYSIIRSTDLYYKNLRCATATLKEILTIFDTMVEGGERMGTFLMIDHEGKVVLVLTAFFCRKNFAHLSEVSA